MSNVMRGRRHALGMSQAQLADLVGVTVRQIARYEAGDQQPVLTVAASIARALEVSLTELAGEFEPGTDLNGEWWLAWEPAGGSWSDLGSSEVAIAQHNKTVRLTADVDHPTRTWSAEFRLWDNAALVGWYRSGDERVGTRGTLYFTVPAVGDHALGRWVGPGDADDVSTGRAWLARERSRVEALADRSIDE